MRSILALIAIVVFWQSQIVMGQEESAREIQVRITINSTHPDADSLANRILEDTRSNLQVYNISVEEVGDDPFRTPFWNFDISISQYNDSLYFGVGVNRFLYPFPDAPLILADNYAGGAQVEITPENQSEAIKRAIDYTTVISLYSIGLCGEAIPLSKQITAELDKEFGKFYYIDDTWVSLLFLQANCAIAAQDFDKAIQLLVQSQRRSDYWEITPSWLRVNYYLAWVYLQVGREDDALNLIRNIVEETSHIPGSGDDYNDALLNSARLYALMSRYDDAITNLNIYSDRFNDDAPAMIYILRGQMYLNLYEWDKSLNDFNTAIELAPEYADAYFQRGVLYYSILQTGQELREEALADFQHYLELAPDGEHAEQAREYAAKIEAELAALNE